MGWAKDFKEDISSTCPLESHSRATIESCSAMANVTNSIATRQPGWKAFATYSARPTDRDNIHGSQALFIFFGLSERLHINAYLVSRAQGMLSRD